MKFNALVLASTLLGMVPMAWAGKPPAGLATQVGVSIHAIVDDREFDQMAKAGIEVVRLDLTWQRIERERGRYEWDYYDRLVQKIVDKGMRPMIILAYSNTLYESTVEVRKQDSSKVFSRTAAPQSQASIDAYIRWSLAVVERYGKFDPMFEIWNEPDHAFFWPPDGSPEAYIKLATATCQAIRKASPSAYLLGPGAAHVPRGAGKFPAFLDAVIDSPLPKCLDALSVHPYLDRGQIDATGKVWGAIEQRLTEAASGKAGLQLISSEWGLSTYQGRIGEAERASYLTKMLVLNSASGVPVSVWYNWRDNGTDGSVAENRFGLIDTSLAPHPAMAALGTFTATLRGRKFLCERQAPANRGYAAYFQGAKAGEVTAVVWSAKGARLDEVIGSGWRLPDEAHDATGAPVALGPKTSTEVGTTPLYLRLASPSATNAASPCS